MSVNTMSFEQVAAILNDINKGVTGREEQIAPKNTAEFVSVATSVLQAGYDPVMGSISQMVTKTIFSIRPYERHYKELERTRQEWGAITRKLQMIDREAVRSAAYELVDGESIDPFKVNLPKTLQTNFYGFETYQRDDTTTLQQLDNAFMGPEQLGEFMAMKIQNISDQIEQDHESLARMTVANFIAGKVAAENGVVHCLTEFNEETGLNVDSTTVYSPENFPHFCEWLVAKVEILSKRMTERTIAYQIQITDKQITRHTPQRDQRIYLFEPLKISMEKRVLAGEYHDNYLKLAKNEGVNFWQNFLDPMKISVKPSYLKADGTIEESQSEIEVDKVIGVIFDRDALGYTIHDYRAVNSPVNQKGLYYNTTYTFTDRYWNDFTEKGIVLLMD